MSKVPALVMGLNPNGLGLIKSLVSEGVKVTALDHMPESWRDSHVWMSSRTRLCSKLLFPLGTPDEELVEAMLEWASAYDEKIPVLPSSDSFLYLLSRHREVLEPHFAFHVPDEETLELLMKKGSFHDFCDENGIPAPKTVSEVTLELAEEMKDKLVYPCLVKPEYRGPEWTELFGKEKALEVSDPAELLQSVTDALPAGEGLMIQEIISGPDSNLFFTHGFFSEDFEALGMWSGRKLRQYPAGYGTSTLVETVRLPGLIEITCQIAKKLGLRGYVSIEFKFDPRDDSYRILEVTPGRSWYPHYLGASVGVNLPFLWYRDLLGEENLQPITEVPEDGIAWVDEYRDLVAAYGEWRRGNLNIREWLASYARVRSLSLTSLRDPLPAIFILARLSISVLKRLSFRRGGED